MYVLAVFIVIISSTIWPEQGSWRILLIFNLFLFLFCIPFSFNCCISLSVSLFPFPLPSHVKILSLLQQKFFNPEVNSPEKVRGCRKIECKKRCSLVFSGCAKRHLMRKPRNCWKLYKLAIHTYSLSMTVMFILKKMVPGGSVSDLKNVIFKKVK